MKRILGMSSNDSAEFRVIAFTRCVSLVFLLLSSFLFLVLLSENKDPGSAISPNWIWSGFATGFVGLAFAYGWWMRRPWARFLTVAVMWPLAVCCVIHIVTSLLRLGIFPEQLFFLSIPLLPFSSVVLYFSHCIEGGLENRNKAQLKFTIPWLAMFVVFWAVIFSMWRFIDVDQPGHWVKAALSLAANGDREDAMRVARSTADRYPSYKTRVWEELAYQFAQDGDASAAIEAVDCLEVPEIRSNTLAAVAQLFRGEPSDWNKILEAIASSTDRTHLSLIMSTVSDKHLSHLSTMSNLEELDLSRTSISDAGLSHLKDLTGLKSLRLQSTQVTQSGVEQLKGQLPNCKIEF